jgi:hypothetical protein
VEQFIRRGGTHESQDLTAAETQAAGAIVEFAKRAFRRSSLSSQPNLEWPKYVMDHERNWRGNHTKPMKAEVLDMHALSAVECGTAFEHKKAKDKVTVS